MKDFINFNLPTKLTTALTKLNFITPTPIQASVIPVALEGKDIIGTSQTGTGKTGAFSIPLLARLLNSQTDSALIITPTRELATQVMNVQEQMLGKNSGIKTTLLIGGESISKQLTELRAKPRLIIGTPGRINDHLKRGSVKLNNISFLVLDEIDRMLDMGFGIQIDTIISELPKSKQTLMFSATLPNNILKIAQKYLIDPVRVSIGQTTSPVAKIKQETIKLSEPDKYNQLLSQLEQRTGSIIVFIKTKSGADKMVTKLKALNHAADVLHGDLKQSRRDRAIRLFRSRKNRIMIATDIAARGLDIPHIEHVINYDLPQCPEDYIHRIGRTARAGTNGEAVNLITPQDGKKWNAICRLINPDQKPEKAISKPRSFRSDRSGAPRTTADRSGAPRTTAGRSGAPRTTAGRSGAGRLVAGAGRRNKK